MIAAAVTLKVIWPDPTAKASELCPGGCGMIHRTCCDSVLGGEHQTRCHLANAMLEQRVRPWWGRAIVALRRNGR